MTSCTCTLNEMITVHCIPICYRALLYVAHGVGEHMGRYEKLGQFLAENGILVYGHDHGKYRIRYYESL